MELDLKKTVAVLYSKIWTIVAATLVGAILFLIVNIFFITPKYTSTALLYVSNVSERKTSVVTSSDVAVSKQLVDTCVVILNSRTVLDKVAEQAGLGYSATKIKKMISARSESSTEVFRISVTHTDPREAQIIADAILKVAPGEIKRVMNAGAVSIIDYATLPLAPSSPNIPKNTFLGAMLGAMLAIGLILITQVFDSRIKNELDLAESFDFPIIGVVPSFRMAEKTSSSKRKKGRVK